MTSKFEHSQRDSLHNCADERLIFSYAKGEMRAFDVLYSRHKQPLFNYLRRQSHNDVISEELSHDVWLAVIKQATLFEVKASFKTWLYTIAHNRLVDYWRKAAVSNQVLFDDLTAQQNALNVDSNLEFSIQDRSLELLEIEQLLSVLTVLSTEQMTALLLKIEGFSQAEIAEITQVKQETVKSRLRYATKRLRLSMEAAK